MNVAVEIIYPDGTIELGMKGYTKLGLRRRAWSLTRNAISRGDLVRPEVCEECEEEDDFIEAHHEDYTKPLEVEWLCRSCHRQRPSGTYGKLS